MKQLITIILFMNVSITCTSQCVCHSYIKKEDRKDLITNLLNEKENAPDYLGFLYDSLSLNTNVIKVYGAAFRDFDSISYSSNFLNYLCYFQPSFWFFNNEGMVFATSYEEKGKLVNLQPPIGSDPELLRIVSKFTDLKKVCIFTVLGFTEWFVSVDGNILVMRDNGWTDVKTYFKERYSITDFKKQLDEVRLVGRDLCN